MGNSPLHDAAYKGQIIVVKLLIEKGAKLNLKAVDGLTPRQLADKYQNNSVVEYLGGLEVASGSVESR